jgi:hypothetical protein
VDKYYVLYNELEQISNEILPYYDINKIKSYSVYIWTKGKYGKNVFDIEKDEIIFYIKDYVINLL